jgi:hypothetical protein
MPKSNFNLFIKILCSSEMNNTIHFSIHRCSELRVYKEGKRLHNRSKVSYELVVVATQARGLYYTRNV